MAPVAVTADGGRLAMPSPKPTPARYHDAAVLIRELLIDKAARVARVT